MASLRPSIGSENPAIETRKSSKQERDRRRALRELGPADVLTSAEGGMATAGPDRLRVVLEKPRYRCLLGDRIRAAHLSVPVLPNQP